MILVEYIVIVASACNKVKPAAPDCTTDHAIVVFYSKVIANFLVEGIGCLWNELLPGEDEDNHDGELKDSLADDMLEHLLADDVFITAMWCPVEQLFGGWLSSQG